MAEHIALAQVVRDKAGNAFSTRLETMRRVEEEEEEEGREKRKEERRGRGVDFSRGGGFSPIRFACWSRVFRAISKFEGKDSVGT